MKYILNEIFERTGRLSGEGGGIEAFSYTSVTLHIDKQ